MQAIEAGKERDRHVRVSATDHTLVVGHTVIGGHGHEHGMCELGGSDKVSVVHVDKAVEARTSEVASIRTVGEKVRVDDEGCKSAARRGLKVNLSFSLHVGV